MFKTQPNEACRILMVLVAVPADAANGEVSDEISALLSEKGTCNPDSNVLDWCYVKGHTPDDDNIVIADAEPEESSVFPNSGW